MKQYFAFGWLSICLVSLLMSPVHAEDTARVYVSPLEAQGLETTETRLLQDRVIGRMAAYKALDVLTEDAAQAMIGKSKTDALLDVSCTNCLADIGKLLKARYLLRMTAVGVGQRIINSLELLDTKRGKILSKQEWSLQRPLQEVDQAFEEVMDALVAPLQRKGELRVYAEEPGSILRVGGQDIPTGKLGRATVTLPIGTHALELTHEQYVPINERMLIAVGKNTWRPDQVTLDEARGPLYAQWWFWTAAAVVIGGGVATYFAIRPDEPKPPEVKPEPLPPYGSIEISF